MFWAGIIGDELVKPFRVAEGVKLTSQLYTAFLNEHFFTLWLYDFPLASICILISCTTMPPLMLLKRPELSLDPSASLDIISGNSHPVLQILTPYKTLVHSEDEGFDGAVQFSSKDSLWKKITEVADDITSSQIYGLTSSVDKMFNVILKNRSYVDK